MRILVVSDTHGDEQVLEELVASQPEAQTVIHLGDGASEAQAVADRFPDRTFYFVRGNCDWASAARDIPLMREEKVAGKRIFFTHGHEYEVKRDFYRVVCAAKERNADVLLFGHTHVPLCEYDDGLYLLNPGSLSRGINRTYGIVDITRAGIAAHTAIFRR